MKARIQRISTPQQSSYIYRTKSARRFEFGWHFHPEYELTYIECSHGRRLVGTSNEPYGDGDLVLLGPNLPHTWYSTHDTVHDAARGSASSVAAGRRHRAYIIQFGAEFLGSEFFHLPELQRARTLLRRSSCGLHFAGAARDEAARRIIAMRRQRPFQRLLDLLELLDLLAGSDPRELCDGGRIPSPTDAHRRRIDLVCRHLHENYLQPIQQAKVAELVHMNPSTFSRFFKRIVGKTFVEYVAELRLQHACRLLITTDLPITAVSAESGFNNLSNFNRRFFRHRRMSPRQFRARHAQGSHASSLPQPSEEPRPGPYRGATA